MEENHKTTLVIFAVVAVLLCFVGVILALTTPTAPSDTTTISTYTPTPTSYTVMYEVTGAYGMSGGHASLTYENAQGGTEQRDVSLPWTRNLYGMRPGDWVYISAQNSDDYGGVTVNIYLNGILVRTSTSYGAFTIATASGTI